MLKIKVFNYQTGEIHEIALTPEKSIQGQCTIGRAASCDLVLVSPEVSRVHARIIFQQGQYYFTDLCSTDGSRINKVHIKANQSYVLQEDDIIRIGGFVLVIAAVETQTSGGDATLGGGRDSDRRWTEGVLTVQCVGVIDETADVRTFCFVADGSPVLFTYKPGQFVTLELEMNGQPVLGSYPISSTPSRPHSLEITVKRVGRSTDAPNGLPGLVSSCLYDHITVGSEVRLIGGPMGNFTCFDKPEQKLLMISDLSGIIPMMSMSRWIHDTSASSDIVFFHSAHSPNDIIFRQELEMMAARLPNFRLAITNTSSETGQARLGNTCRLTEAMLNAIAPDIRERTVYVCGPDSFMQAVKAMLEGLAFPMQNYYSQSLGAAINGKNASKTAVKEPLILPESPFTNGRRVATDFVDSPPLSPAPASTSSQPVEFFAQSEKQVPCDDEETILSFAEQQQKLFPSEKSNSPFSTGLPALYVIAFLSGISIGLFNPFISTLMAQHQVDDVWIGANSTVYFLAVALGTPLVAKILHQIGLRRTMMLGLALMGLSAPLFPLTTQLSLWFVIRAVMGFASCCYLVGGQTGLNHFCHQGNRAIVNGLHALAFSFGFGIGPVMGSALYNFSPKFTFSLGSILILSGIVVVWIGLPERFVVFQPSSRTGIFKKLTLPLHGAFVYGFTISTLVSLYPLYLLQQNYSVKQIGYTFSLFVVGGVLTTIPVTHLADRLGRLNVLLSSVCILLFSMLSLSLVENSIATQIFTFIAGASMSPVFPLALALMGEKLSRAELSSGSALFTAIYSSGCTAGPILSSVTMKIFDERYIFSLIIINFALFGVHIMRQNHQKLAIKNANYASHL